MVTNKYKSEKITVSIPFELKDKLVQLKNELHITASTLYKDALESYVKQKESEKWERGAQLAAKDDEYLSFVEELGSDVGDIYEY